MVRITAFVVRGTWAQVTRNLFHEIRTTQHG